MTILLSIAYFYELVKIDNIPGCQFDKANRERKKEN